MIDTKSGKVEFGQSVYFQNHKRVQARSEERRVGKEC